MNEHIDQMDNLLRPAAICPCGRTYCSQCKRHQRVIRDDWYKGEIIRFIRRYPYPNTSQLVDLARELGITKEELDRKMTILLTQYILKEF